MLKIFDICIDAVFDIYAQGLLCAHEFSPWIHMREREKRQIDREQQTQDNERDIESKRYVTDR